MPQGLQWVKLSPEEIPSRIQAITGKRGRPRNAEKAKPKEPPAAKRGRGRPPKVKMVDLLSKTDARLLKRLEAQGTPSLVPPTQGGSCSPSQPGFGGTPAAGPLPLSLSAFTEVLSDEDKLKMSKIKKKMRRKVQAAAWGLGWLWGPSRSGVEASLLREGHWVPELVLPLPGQEQAEAGSQSPQREGGQEEVQGESAGMRGPGSGEEMEPALPTHPGLCPQAKEKKGKPEKGKDKARPKEKKGKGARKADKGLLAQRRLEERRRQQLILEEMKKPTEDMCLGDHQVGWCTGGSTGLSR